MHLACPDLLLASASPRRRELLSELGVAFEVLRVEVPESPLGGESPWETARRLAWLKLCAAQDLSQGLPVLTADTVVELDGVALGKPRSPEEAVSMLRALMGRSHLVHTAVAVRAAAAWLAGVCSTQVEMRAYTDGEVERYVQSGDPFDKAGGYAIQDRMFRPVERIHVSYSNVVGLPLELASRLLRTAGIPVRATASPDGERSGVRAVPHGARAALAMTRHRGERR